MAIKEAELFKVDPSHAFDFGPVSPGAIFNGGLMPKVQPLLDRFGENEPAPAPPMASPSVSRAQAVFAPREDDSMLPPQRGTPGIPAAAPQEQADYSTAATDRYGDFADFMFKSEARTSGGKLQVYAPPAGDGGGDYEIAGITARHQPKEAAQLKAMIEAGDSAGAEAYAKDFYRRRAAPYVSLTRNKGLQLQLADSVHHRGEGGLRRILQRATGSDARSYKDLIGDLDRNPEALDAFHRARQDYEWEEVDRGRSSREKFRKGLQNRFNNANAAARQLL